jgi:hypothetical protein
VENNTKEPTPLIQARIAGSLALITLITGTFATYVHTKLVVSGDAEATASNIQTFETLFRLGFISSLVMYTVFIFYVLLLYRLLKPVNHFQALTMLTLALVGVPIAMLNQIHQSAALLLVSGADYLKVFAADQVNSQLMFFLDLYKHGVLIGVIFWGLWLFPLGLLVYKSGYFPRILGILLMIGCFGWLLVFVQRFLFPNQEALAYSRFAAHIAELCWMLWLLIKGVNVKRWKDRALESTSS